MVTNGLVVTADRTIGYALTDERQQQIPARYDADNVEPADHRHPGTVDRTRTLDLALAACLRTWRRQEGTP